MTTSIEAVRLTREQRDGLQDHVVGYVCRDLEISARHEDWDAVRKTASRLNAAIPILDQIGWEREGDQDFYELLVDDTARRLAIEMRDGIVDTIRDDAGHEKAECHDRAALAAVDLIGWRDGA